jgi:hypothetical protein
VKTLLPFNWCDRRCELCPLATTCPIPAQTPDDESIDGVLACFDDNIERLTADLAAEGISLDDFEPSSDEYRRLDDAALALIAAVPSEDDLARAMLIAAKIHRITSIPEADDELFADDTVPNLLLIEHVLDALPAVPEVARVRGLLAPWFARIPDEARAVLAALVRAERAPSPWCRVPDRSRVRATPPRTA